MLDSALCIGAHFRCVYVIKVIRSKKKSHTEYVICNVHLFQGVSGVWTTNHMYTLSNFFIVNKLNTLLCR